ncbi:hypothetical protein D3C87_1535410 [compost metagenome]
MATGTDAAAVASGHVSITPLSFSCGIDEKSSEFHGWVNNTLEFANARIGASPQSCQAGCCG